MVHQYTFGFQVANRSYGLASEGLAVSTFLAQGAAASYFVPTNNFFSNQWTQVGFDAAGWSNGLTGIGFDTTEGSALDPLIATDVEQAMFGGSVKRKVLFVRVPFVITDLAQVQNPFLSMRYDDGFVAYLNGKEVVRKGVAKGNGKGAQSVKSHDATKYSYFPLKEFEKHLRDGTNIFAIEGHNASIDSHDFLIDPYLVIED